MGYTFFGFKPKRRPRFFDSFGSPRSSVYIGSMTYRDFSVPRISHLFLLLCLSVGLTLLDPIQAQDEPEDEYILEIERQYGVVDAPDVVARVGEIERRLLEVIPEAETDEREIVIKVLNEDAVNGFALPDGHIYLFKGLVDACETDDMLAGVMSHELVHVFHRHHARMNERQIRGMLIGMAAMVATREGEALMLGQMLAASMVETYGRAAENDADRTGAQWTVEAGYDPVGFLELMQVLEQQSIHRPEPGGNYFTIHPNPDERMANIRAALAEMGIEVPQDVYRVHLSLRFYLPLAPEELETLEEWRDMLSARAEGDGEAEEAESVAGEAGEVEEEKVEVPPSLLSEYTLRQALFEGIDAPADGAYGVVAVGETGVFYITGEDEEHLQDRGENIIRRLGEKFLEGLRNYEVQARTVDGVPALLAARRIIAYATEDDAALVGETPEVANSERVETLKDILYRYYVNRRI